MILVVATTEDGLADVHSRLRRVGVASTEVVAPGGARRLVLAAVDDEAAGHRLVARLRADGVMAVLRPVAGARLEAWSRHTMPVTIGGRLSVCFAWSEHDRRDLGDAIELDPGGGFGTVDHPATRLLLEELVERVTGGERVLDVGCGSGVLGLCALRLGASKMVGVDIDPGALVATRRNATLNGVDHHVVATARPLDEIEGDFDIVVANIGRAGIVALAPELIGHVAPGGWLAVSGFSPAQCPLVTAVLAPLDVLASRVRGEWSALVLSPQRTDA